MLAERIRNWGFWASDFAHGSPIRNHCQDIEAQLSSDTRSAERLEAMLRYATAHTPFFSKHRDFACLQDFPIQNKASMKADYDAFRSDEFAGQALHIMHTSGSTGTPFEVPQKDRKAVFALEALCSYGEGVPGALGRRRGEENHGEVGPEDRHARVLEVGVAVVHELREVGDQTGAVLADGGEDEPALHAATLAANRRRGSARRRREVPVELDRRGPLDP